MGYCKDCRNWENGWCGKVGLGEDRERPRENDMLLYAYASDDSGLEAGLKTGAMFGCVQFQ